MNKIRPVMSGMLDCKGIRRGCVFVVAGVRTVKLKAFNDYWPYKIWGQSTIIIDQVLSNIISPDKVFTITPMDIFKRHAVSEIE